MDKGDFFVVTIIYIYIERERKRERIDAPPKLQKREARNTYEGVHFLVKVRAVGC